MKHIFFYTLVAIMATFGLSAADGFAIMTDITGNSYIKINEDLASFGFTVTDRQTPNSSFGVVYVDPNGNKMDLGLVNKTADYSGLAKDGSLWLYRNDAGNITSYRTARNPDGTYTVTFTGFDNENDRHNGYGQGQHKGNGYGHNNGNGGKNGWGNGANIYANDEWFVIGGFNVIIRDGNAPTGMPLPGFNETILVSASILLLVMLVQVLREQKKIV